MRRAWLAAWLLGAGCSEDGAIIAPTDDFESNLPIALVETWGVPIPDDPKIPASLRLIVDPEGGRNALVDEPVVTVEGGIEYRGRSSRHFPKQQFGFEARDERGNDLPVSLLGMPEEADWILHGPWSDKTLLRNHLAYWMAGQAGHYAARSTYVEVFLNTEGPGYMSDRYWGIYLLMEKVEQGPGRVDVAPLERHQLDPSEISGGYVLTMDFKDGGCILFPMDAGCVNLVYPEFDDAHPDQVEWITSYFEGFEEALAGPDFADPEAGYAAWIDVGSWVDALLLHEVYRNDDGLRRSTFMTKDRDGLLAMGPPWDCNICLGNHPKGDPDGWQLWDSDVPPWWHRLVEDPAFHGRMVERWRELRADALSTETVHAEIESRTEELAEASVREFTRWPAVGTFRKFNTPPLHDTWEEEVAFLAGWLEQRLAWIDAHIEDYGE